MTEASTLSTISATTDGLSFFRYQLRFSKTGDLVWIGHQDLMRVLERLLRRASIPVALSQGFNPRPKLNFVQALGLGIEAHREVLEMELSQWLTPEFLMNQLNQTSPPGLNFLDARQLLTRKSSQASKIIYTFDKDIPDHRREATSLAMEEFLNANEFRVDRTRDSQIVSIDLRTLVDHLDWTDDHHVRMSLHVTPQATARPEEVLAVLGLKDLYTTGLLVRHDVILRDEPNKPDPKPSSDDKTG
jgi:radical SAM-linked protein